MRQILGGFRRGVGARPPPKCRSRPDFSDPGLTFWNYFVWGYLLQDFVGEGLNREVVIPSTVCVLYMFVQIGRHF